MCIYEVSLWTIEPVITGMVWFGLGQFFNLEMTELELMVLFFRFGLVRFQFFSG
jgi:hypothetical protein